MNTITINTTLIIAMVCMIIGFVTGGIIGMSNKNKKKKKEEAEQPAPPVPAAPPPLADPEKYTELLRLWRSKDSSGLFVETSGHLLANSNPLNPAQKKRFIDLIKELAGWLEISVREVLPADNVNAPASTGNSAHPEVQAESGTEVPSVLRKASDPVKTNPIPAAPVVSAVPMPPVIPPPQANMPVASSQSATPPPPPIPVPVSSAAARTPSEPLKKKAASMVEQIDEVLQELIQRSDNPGQMIKLVEEPREGVIVWVGQEHFIGIDAVTDQSAKDLIRAAVKEWDRRTETH